MLGWRRRATRRDRLRNLLDAARGKERLDVRTVQCAVEALDGVAHALCDVGGEIVALVVVQAFEWRIEVFSDEFEHLAVPVLSWSRLRSPVTCPLLA